MTSPEVLYPEGARYVEIEIPRAQIGSLVEVSGDLVYQDGVQLHITGFGGVLTFLDAEFSPVDVQPQGLTMFDLHVPLESAEDAEASRAGFEGLVEHGIDVRIFLRRNLYASRPYDVATFTHDFGSFEIMVGTPSE